MKSQFSGFLLTFFFGPLGNFYSSIGAGIGLTLAAIVFGLMTAGIGALLIWPISIIVSAASISSHNEKITKAESDRKKEIKKADRQHAELLEAAKAPEQHRQHLAREQQLDLVEAERERRHEAERERRHNGG
jgi:hypothetical protein